VRHPAVNPQGGDRRVGPCISFVMHNYVNLNIGWKLTAEQAIAYFVEWLAVGIVIGTIYRPAR
jgi:hypothetical protein